MIRLVIVCLDRVDTNAASVTGQKVKVCPVCALGEATFNSRVGVVGISWMSMVALLEIMFQTVFVFVFVFVMQQVNIINIYQLYLFLYL